MEMIVNQEENLQDIQKDFGLIKLRGKGFGILTECYKKVGGHHQPMTTEGYPLKGESYQLGKSSLISDLEEHLLILTSQYRLADS